MKTGATTKFILQGLKFDTPPAPANIVLSVGESDMYEGNMLKAIEEVEKFIQRHRNFKLNLLAVPYRLHYGSNDYVS